MTENLIDVELRARARFFNIFDSNELSYKSNVMLEVDYSGVDEALCGSLIIQRVCCAWKKRGSLRWLSKGSMR